MLSWVIQISIISVIFIFLIHHLFEFFKSTLTVPKIKDLVNAPNKKYESIYSTIYKTNSKEFTIVEKDDENMKNELKDFFKKQLNSKNDTTNINDLATSENYYQ